MPCSWAQVGQALSTKRMNEEEGKRDSREESKTTNETTMEGEKESNEMKGWRMSWDEEFKGREELEQ